MPAPRVARRTGRPAAFPLTLQALSIGFDAVAQASCKFLVKHADRARGAAAAGLRGLSGEIGSRTQHRTSPNRNPASWRFPEVTRAEGKKPKDNPRFVVTIMKSAVAVRGGLLSTR